MMSKDATNNSRIIIDCTTDPFVPEGWEVIKHQLGGQIEWNPDKVELYFWEDKNRVVIEGNELRKRLSNKPVMNANVLDYLLEHTELIPDEWKGKLVFFWGTIYYERVGGSMFVRCLNWEGGEWHWHFIWLKAHWHGGHPAVVFRK